MFTWVDEWSIQRLFQGIVEGYFRGCSGLFRGGLGRFLDEKLREITSNKREKSGTL